MKYCLASAPQMQRVQKASHVTGDSGDTFYNYWVASLTRYTSTELNQSDAMTEL